jgi:hypothetical protein
MLPGKHPDGSMPGRWVACCIPTSDHGEFLMAKKKLNAKQIHPEILLFQTGDEHKKARWSYRITLKGAENINPVERLISSHFAYSEIHWEYTNQLFSTREEPPERIQQYALRILAKYREEYGRTGRLTLSEPTLLSLVTHLASEEDKALIERRMDAPKGKTHHDLQSGHVMLVHLDKATYYHLKRWTEQFGDHEPKVRAILKKVMMDAYARGDIKMIPAIL